MNPLLLKLVVTGVVAVVFVNGWIVGHYVTPPQAITGGGYDQIVKYCTAVGTGNGNSLPAPFNNLIPQEYKNGSYAVYVCKVK